MQEEKSNNYISLQEATEYCSYTQEYLSLRARQGKLKAVKIGRNWLTKKEWVKEYVERAEEYNNNNLKAKKLVPPPKNLPIEEIGIRKYEETKKRIFRHFVLRTSFAFALVFVLLTAGIVSGKESFKSVFNDLDPYVKEISQAGNRLVLDSVQSFKNVYEISSGKLSLLVQEFSEGFDGSVIVPVTNLSSEFRVQSSKFGKELSSYTYIVGQAGDIIIKNTTKLLSETISDIPHSLANVSETIDNTQRTIVLNLLPVSTGLAQVTSPDVLKSTLNTFKEYGQWLTHNVKYQVSRIVITQHRVLVIGKRLKEVPQDIARSYSFANEFFEQKLGRLNQNVKSGYLAFNYFIEEKLDNASRTVFSGLKSFAQGIREIPQVVTKFFRKEIAIEKPKVEKPEEEFVKKGELEKLQKELEELKEKPEKVIEVSRITKIEPIKEITKEIKTLDDESLKRIQTILSQQETEVGKLKLTASRGYINLPPSVGPSGAVSLTTLGTITAGSWQASSIEDAYVVDDLTIASTKAGSFSYSGTSPALTVTQSGAGDILNFFDGSTEVFTVLDGGNVGIGTVSPTANLQVAQGTAGVGTVSNDAGGITVTGVGTQFLNTFKVGDTITIVGQTVAISAIASDTSMTTAAITNANAGVAYTLVGGTRLSVLGSGNVGIGTTSPTSLFSVGASSQFQVDSSGDIVKLKNLTYSWPSAHVTNGLLVNDGSGTLIWSTIGGSGISPDSLDFTEFQDTMDLDADLILNQTAYTWTQNFTGTTTTGLTYNANSLTSGKALYVTSTATAFTGNLADLTISGSNAANTGSVLSLTNSGILNTGTTFYLKHYATGTNNLAMRVDDESGDATPFVIDGAGNVGIGTTSPDYTLQVNGTIAPETDSAFDLGSSTPLYWANAYIDKLYLNATATLDGSVAGLISVVGNITFTGSPTLAIANLGSMTFTDGTNTLMQLADSGAFGTLTINTISPTTINAFSLGGSITGAGFNITGLGTLSATTLTEGTLSISAGAITGGTTAAFSTSVTSPIIYGSSAASGNLTLRTTSDVTKGSYILSELTSNGFVKTSGGTGTLSIDTTSYVTSVSGTSPITSSGGTTPAIGLTQTSITNLNSALATGLLKITTTTGLLSIAVAGTDYQAAGNYITALTGEVTATGPGSVAATIASQTSLTWLGKVSDETGTGAWVFGTSPTFTTQITSPLIYGGAAANEDITIEGTSHATKTTSYVILQPTSGNVGIGTTSPTAHLQIDGDISAAAWTTDGIAFDSNAATYTDTSTAAAGTVAVRTANSFGAPTFTSTNAITVTDAFTLYVPKPIATASTTITRANSAYFEGNVGIGTTSPGRALQVGSFFYVNTAESRVGIGKDPVSLLDIGSSTRYFQIAAAATPAPTFRYDDNSDKYLTLENRNGGNGFGYGILFNLGNGTDAVNAATILVEPEQTWTSTATTQDSRLALSTTLDGTSTEYMRITSTGNVGIGTTSPTAHLQIDGNISAAAWTTDGIAFDSNAATYTDTSTAAAGTVAVRTANSFGAPTFTSTNAITVTDAFTLYVPKPIATASTTITRANSAYFEGNVGIGTTGPTSLFSVGASSQFQVDSSGDIVKLKNLTYSWPSAHVANGLLTNDGAGTLTWATIGSSGITPDSLDFTEFQDTLDLDTDLILNQAAYTWTQNFTGTTTTGLTYNANSLTSGKALYLASTATAFTGNLADLTLSGSNAANTGSVLSLTNSGILNTGTTFYLKHYATGTNNLAMRVDDESGDTTPFVIDGDGNVGIGTADPQNTLQIGDGSSVVTLGLRSPDGNTDSSQITFEEVYLGSGLVDFAIINNTDADRLEITSSWVDPLMVFTNSGKVGIGTATPTAHLQIDGNISAAAWTTDGIAFDSNAATYTDTSTAAAGTVAVRTANSFGAPTFTSTNAITVTDAFTLYVPKPIATASTTITRANSAYFEGNVGIGTTEPGTLLSLSGAFGTGTVALRITNTSAIAANNAAIIDLWANTNPMAKISGLAEEAGGSNGALAFYTRLSDSVGEKVRITSAGRVGIGTTTPTAHLQIDGDISAAAWTTDGIAFDSNAATYTDTSTAAAGTVAVRTANSFGAPTFTSTNAITVTDAFTLYVPKPIATASTTITRANSAYFEGNVGIGTTSPDYTLQVNGTIAPETDSAFDLGSSTPLYWANAYIDKLYLNSTATLDGSVAGLISVVGNISTLSNGILTLLPNGTGYTRIGDAGVTSQSFNTNDDLLVSGRLEVDGIAYFDNAWTTFYAYSATADNLLNWRNESNLDVRSEVTDTLYNQFNNAIGSALGRQYIISDLDTYYERDYDHAVQTNPTLFIQSVTDPDTNNTQWLSLAHNQTNGVINTGTGNLTFGQTLTSDTASTDDLGTSSIYWANTYTDKIYLNSTATLDGASAGVVALTGRLNVSGITQFQDASSTIEYTTDHMSINKGADADVYLFEDSVSGEVKHLRIYGYGANGGGLAYWNFYMNSYNNFVIESSFAGGMLNLPYTRFSSNVEMGNVVADSKKIYFGAANDASIYYDGTNLIVNPKDVGTGYLGIIGSVVPTVDSTNNLGASTPLYWANAYIDKIYLNSTAALDGSSAGIINITGNVGIGTATPTAHLQIDGNISAAAWTTDGIAFDSNAATYTDTSTAAAGTVAVRTANSFGAPTFTSTNAITVTDAFTLYVPKPIATASTTITRANSAYFEGNVGIGTTTPFRNLHVNGVGATAIQITNTTISSTGADGTLLYADVSGNFRVQNLESGNLELWTNNTQYLTILSGGNVGIGTTSPIAHLQIDGDISAAAWTTDGIAFDSNAATYTDTSTAAAGTVAVRTANSFGAPTFTSTNAITVTDAFTLYVPKPIATASTTITRANSAYFEGNVGIGTTSPDYTLQVNGTIAPETDSAFDLGSSTPLYWANAYIDKLYLNSTATLDGVDSGIVTVSNVLRVNTVSQEEVTNVIDFLAKNAADDIIVSMTEERGRGSGNGANGIGLYHNHRLENGNGDLHDAAKYVVAFNDVTVGSEDAYFAINTMTAGSYVEGLRVTGLLTTLAGTLTTGGTIASDADSTDDLGTTSIYWANTYTDKLYLNSTATLDGASAGVVALTGRLNVSGITQFQNASSTIEYTTDHMSINKGADANVSLFEGAVTPERPEFRIYGYGDDAGSLGFTSMFLDSWNNFRIDTQGAYILLYNSVNLRTDLWMGRYGGDSYKIYFGMANDASMYYDGTNLLINPKDVGTGYLGVMGSVVPTVDSTNDLGASTPLYWANAYIDKLYLNSTATLDGATAGAISIVGNVGIGTTTPTAHLQIDGNISAAAWTTDGIAFDSNAATYTDTSTAAAGTVAVRTANSFGAPTFTSTNAITVTDAFTLYVPKPIATASTTITRANSAYFEGNVGIGTTTPSGILEVFAAGAGRTAGALRVVDKNVTIGQLSSTSNDTTIFKVVSRAGGSIIETDLSSNALLVSGGGNVGIGTTLPASKLDVVGTLSATTAGSTYTASKTTTTITATVGTFASTDAGKFFVWANGTIDIITAYISATQVTVAASATIASQTGYTRTANLYVDSSGNVGVGTTSPATAPNSGTAGKVLDITGASPIIALHNSSDSLKETDFYNATSGLYIDSVGAATAANNQIVFRTSNTNSATFPGVTGMTITSGGNVGIGTTSPDVKLHVYEDSTTKSGVLINASSTSSSYYAMDVQSGGTSRLYVRADGNVGIGTTAPGAKLDVATLGDVDSLRMSFTSDSTYRNSIVGHWDGATAGSSWMALKVASGEDTQAEVMRLLGNGNVGIGTTTPTAHLQIDGNISAAAWTTDGIAFDSNAATYTDTSTAAAGTVAVRTANSFGAPTFTSTNAITVTDAFTLYVPKPIATASTTITRANSAYFEGNVGIGTTGPGAILQVTGGGLCVGSDTDCNTDNNTEGYVYASSTAMTVYDVAENYPTKDEALGAGEVVSLDKDNAVFVKRSSSAYDSNLVGVISTEPAVLLGGFKTSQSQFKNEIQVPVALSGRVPVKVSLENGPIEIGNYLTSSNIPGLAIKATEPGRVIGMALESCDGSDEDGKIMVFVNPHWSLGSLAEDGSLATTSNETLSEEQPTILDQFTLAIKNSLKKLGLFVENGIAKINELVAEKITAKKLCLEGDDGETICVDKNQLKELLTKNPIQNINGSSGSSGGGESDGSTGGSAPDVCDATHLNLCSAETDCQSAGGYWYNETCDAEPEPEQPVVEEAEPTPEPEPEQPSEQPADQPTE